MLRMALEELQRGKWWIEGVLRWLTEPESVQITSIGWRDHDGGGKHELEVVTPQGTRCETFSNAELKTLMTDESVRTSVERRLASLIGGDKR